MSDTATDQLRDAIEELEAAELTPDEAAERAARASDLAATAASQLDAAARIAARDDLAQTSLL